MATDSDQPAAAEARRERRLRRRYAVFSRRARWWILGFGVVQTQEENDECGMRDKLSVISYQFSVEAKKLTTEN